MGDTIVALATPVGRSGIGVIRLSGDRALEIAGHLTDGSHSFAEPRTPVLCRITDKSDGRTVDTALFTYFKAPNSFTGEDVVEISCHGSPVVLRQVIDLCLENDARMAQAGEFTLRALSNGKINLAQAEAVRDLIDSQTKAAARQSARQLEGALSNELQPLKDGLLDSIVILESALEFVEDDLPEFQSERIVLGLEEAVRKIEALASTFASGKLIRDGLRVALAGRPNVGKSSLFNRLLGRDRAIVTEIAGTTRDELHERFTIRDIPISLIDTAGLRDAVDTVEKIGVERSRRAIADADVVIVMLDGSEKATDEDARILSSTEKYRRIVAVNKNDVLSPEFGLSDVDALYISAMNGDGLEELAEAIIAPFASYEADTSGFLVSDARHHDLLVRSGSEIRGSIELLTAGSSEEIVLVGLHNALRYLGEITGETTPEDMLTRIFSTFCIGK